MLETFDEQLCDNKTTLLPSHTCIELKCSSVVVNPKELLDKIRDHSDEVANAAGDNLAVFFR
jgi:hypothetical protein